MNKTYKTGLTIDGVYGSKTKSALIKGLQTELNTKYNSRLTVDGVFGNYTIHALHAVSKGARGGIVKVLQGLLMCNGYSTGGLDGVFGNATVAAVKNYQKKKSLTVDGVVGVKTFTKLCG